MIRCAVPGEQVRQHMQDIARADMPVPGIHRLILKRLRRQAPEQTLARHWQSNEHPEHGNNENDRAKPKPHLPPDTVLFTLRDIGPKALEGSAGFGPKALKGGAGFRLSGFHAFLDHGQLPGKFVRVTHCASINMRTPPRARPAAVPYASLQASERVRLWGALGHGAGEVTLATGLGETLRTDIGWTMAAAGMRADLLETPKEMGVYEPVKKPFNGRVNITRWRSRPVSGSGRRPSQELHQGDDQSALGDQGTEHPLQKINLHRFQTGLRLLAQRLDIGLCLLAQRLHAGLDPGDIGLGREVGGEQGDMLVGERLSLLLGEAGAGQALDEAVGVEGDGFRHDRNYRNHRSPRQVPMQSDTSGKQGA